MSRFKSVRSKALTDVRREQILKDLKTLREQIIHDITDLKIGSPDYDALSVLNQNILTCGETISSDGNWDREMLSFGR